MSEEIDPKEKDNASKQEIPTRDDCKYILNISEIMKEVFDRKLKERIEATKKKKQKKDTS